MIRVLLLAAAALVLAVFVPLAPVWAGATHAQRTEEEAIRRLYADYDAAWNAGDAKRLVMVWAEDADHVEPDGTPIKGRAAIEESLARRLAAELKGSQSKQTVESVRFIKPDVAIVDANYEVTGMPHAAGAPGSTLHGRYVDIWVKQKGKWRIVADRPLAERSAK